MERSCRLLDTACSLNEEDFFESRLRREKLSVCDLLTFRPNILDRFGVVVKSWSVDNGLRYHQMSSGNDECCRFGGVPIFQDERRKNLRVWERASIYNGCQQGQGCLCLGGRHRRGPGNSEDAISQGAALKLRKPLYAGHTRQLVTEGHVPWLAEFATLARRRSQPSGIVQDQNGHRGKGGETSLQGEDVMDMKVLHDEYEYRPPGTCSQKASQTKTE
jgi:hypothetical protein